MNVWITILIILALLVGISLWEMSKWCDDIEEDEDEEDKED